jgi:hypothetical protein
MEVSRIEFADGECDPVDTAWRDVPAFGFGLADC